jgi:putative hydrolase of HD superfamily
MDDTETNWERIARFLFEGSMLKRTWRTGYPFLGKGRESVAAHTFGVILSAMMLARDIPGVDMERLLKLCLLHDLPEARTGDANAVHKRYVTIHEKSAITEMIQGLPGGEEIADLLSEFMDCKTTESVLAHDADQLDMLLSLKEHLDTGSSDAALWIPYVKDRLKTEGAKALAGAILKEHWASWWMRQLLGENSK